MKNKLNILLFAIFLLTTIGLNGQNENIVIDDTYQCSCKIDSLDGLPIFKIVEKMPEYIGGSDSLMNFIAKNIRYSEEDLNKDFQFKVYLTFVIDTSGYLTNVCIMKPLYSGTFTNIEKESMRVFTLMQRWTPGEQNGKKVPVRYIFPINFTPTPRE